MTEIDLVVRLDSPVLKASFDAITMAEHQSPRRLPRRTALSPGSVLASGRPLAAIRLGRGRIPDEDSEQHAQQRKNPAGHGAIDSN